MGRRTARFAIAALAILLVLDRPSPSQGHLKRCVTCRSRGELGSCKDPFTMNSTQIELEKGVKAVPCVSGWCLKLIENKNLNNEYGVAMERTCLHRAPDDNEERCNFAKWKNKNVFMCLCKGDLCNSATSHRIFPILGPIGLVGALTRWL